MVFIPFSFRGVTVEQSCQSFDHDSLIVDSIDRMQEISFHFHFQFLGMVAPRLEKTDLQEAMQ